MCGRPLTGSWSKGRNGYYAYYHCQRQCCAVNVSKAELEGAFADELALLPPTAGYMRLVKDRILHVWEQRRAEAKDRTPEQEKRVKVIQQKLDRLDEAFLFAQSIDVVSYERQRDRLREELTLAQIDHHADAVDELDVQRILAFAERGLPRASDLWVQASSTTSSGCSSYFSRKESPSRTQYPGFGRGRAHTCCRKWRLANSRPDPVFRYRSNSIAGSSSSNSMTTRRRQGRRGAVCVQSPLLCAARRAVGSAVTPT
jgi:hypothetical protein